MNGRLVYDGVIYVTAPVQVSDFIAPACYTLRGTATDHVLKWAGGYDMRDGGSGSELIMAGLGRM